MKKALFIIISVIIILCLCALITAAGAFSPVWVETYEGIYNMSFGFPLKFATQTTTLVFNAIYFPRYVTPQYFNESFETDIDIGFLSLSILINLAISAAIYVFFIFLHRIYRKHHPKKPKKPKDEYIPVFK